MTDPQMPDPTLKTLLQSMADEVTDVRPLDHRALGRARIRRLAVVATAMVSVLALAAGGTSLALSLGSSSGDVVAPAGDETPTPPQPMAGTIVAHGYTEDGHEWWLSAEQDENGNLCAYLQHDTGDIRPHCAPFEGTDDVALGKDDVRGGLFGWVHADTKKLWVTWPRPYEDDSTPEDETEEDDPEGGGSSVELEESPSEDPSSSEDDSGGRTVEVTFEGETEVALYDAPEGFPFPVQFYALIPAPANAEAIYIELNNGDATVLVVSDPEATTNGERADAEPPTLGFDEREGKRREGRRLVAEGEHQGYEWKLYERMKPKGLRCIGLRWADGQFGWSGGCSAAVPAHDSFQFAMSNFPGQEAVAFFAAVRKDVASLELRLGDGRSVFADIIEGPSDANYAVVWPPFEEKGPYKGTVRGTVRSRDEDGNVLDTKKLCTISSGSTGSACSSDYRR